MFSNHNTKTIFLCLVSFFIGLQFRDFYNTNKEGLLVPSEFLYKPVTDDQKLLETINVNQEFKDDESSSPSNHSPPTTSNNKQQQATTTTPKCEMTLNELVLDLARYSAPKDSLSWTKNKRILSQATRFHIGPVKKIFHSAQQNLIKMLTSYNITRFMNDTVNSDLIANGDENDIILFEFSHNKKNKCTGSKCKQLPRIVIQSEQVTSLPWGLRYCKDCHKSSNCVLWDFSELNIEWSKRHNISDSFLLVPLMFHDRLQHFYNNNNNNNNEDESNIIPYKERNYDFSFFGMITWRREIFKKRYILSPPPSTKNNNDNNNKKNQSEAEEELGLGLLGNYTSIFERSMSNKRNVEAYRNSKICLIVHSYDSSSGGEYHRLSDLKRSGCIPIMESFQDNKTSMVLNTCAGIKFAELDDIPYTIIDELKRIDETDSDILRSEQLSFDRWWSNGISYDSFLSEIFGNQKG